MASGSRLTAKHTFLNLDKKLEILNKLSKGETGVSLARAYGVGTSTISDIKKNKETILAFASKIDSQDGSKKRKTTRSAKDSTLEEAIFIWFSQRRSLGEPISGPLICEKAIQFNEQLGGPSKFKASTGWLKNFKNRHGIRELDVQGEILSGNVSSAEEFKEKFLVFVGAEGYSRDDVYNADETGVNWRSLPRKTLASRREESAPGFKVSKERITVMVCSNASGTHPLSLLVISKSKKPRCFKNVPNLPVKYKSHRSAWMTSNLFTEWYTHDFIPEVEEFRKKEGKTGKVLLLLDNAPTHPSVEKLNSINANFSVMFLPPNVTAIIQPIDQSVIAKIKKIYRKMVLRRLLLAERDEESVVSFMKKLDLKDCMFMLADAWKTLSPQNLQNSWNKLWPLNSASEIQESEEQDDLTVVLKLIPGCEECDKSDTNDWLNSDSHDRGYQILNDEEIVSAITAGDSSLDSIEDTDDDVTTPGPSHAEAYQALETAILWLENQRECAAAQLDDVKKNQGHGC